MDVISKDKKNFDVILLSANNNYRKLVQQAKKFKVKNIIIKNEVYYEKVKKLLQIPEDAMTMALVPLGYPIQGKWATPKRQSVEDVTHWGMWGNQRQR